MKSSHYRSEIKTPIFEWPKLHGVNWGSKILRWKQLEAASAANAIMTEDISKFMDICEVNDWNLIRLPVYQEPG